MQVLGISCYYHDSAAVLVSDGKVIVAALEERFTRRKHDSSYPVNAINFCLKYAKTTSQELDYIVFYEKPFLKFERIYQSILASAPKSFGLFRNATINTFTDKLWIRSTIVKHLDIDKEKILFVPHHLSHAASAFLCSPYERSAILTIDGVGEWSTASIGIGSPSEIKILEELRFPASVSPFVHLRLQSWENML